MRGSGVQKVDHPKYTPPDPTKWSSALDNTKGIHGFHIVLKIDSN
jgi:hypothetical protein